MPAWSRDGPLASKREDEQRLRLTLCLSVLLHAFLLLAWTLPPVAWKVADSAVLTVVLRGAAPLPRIEPAPQEPTRVVLAVDRPATAVFSVPPQAPMPRAVVTPAARPQAPLPAAMPAPVALRSTPGRVSNAPPIAVGVKVLLVVGAGGRVEQIYWDQLPALTDEQLRRVESAIRAKTYRPSQTLSETVDVRSLLKLAPARPPEDSSAAPAAAEG